MRTRITDRQKFDTLQQRIGAAQREYDTARATLIATYRDVAYASKGRRDRLDRLSACVDRYSDKLYALLDRVSPRDWRSGVPVAYVHTRLTWYDATTRAELGAVPPAAYGCTDAQMRAFAAALPTPTTRDSDPADFGACGDCPTCGSLSPWRCGCSEEEAELDRMGAR